MRFLLDTNVVSEAVKPAPDPGVLARLKASEGVAALSTVTWQQLRYGTRRLPDSRRREALEVYVHGLPARFPVLPYDQPAAEWHARERARLAGMGRQPAFADGQVAATAATNGLLLVTRNLADFHGFEGLEVQTWW